MAADDIGDEGEQLMNAKRRYLCGLLRRMVRMANHIEERRPSISRLRVWIERRTIWISLFLPLVVVFALTATTDQPFHIDAFTNAVTAWHLGMDGSPIAPEMELAASVEQQGNLGWFVMSPRGPVSLYPPGAPLLAAPLYSLVDQPLTPLALGGSNRPDLGTIDTAIPSVVPATTVAVVATALAVVFLCAMAMELGLSKQHAVACSWMLGLGTGLWSVAADQLWQHGPAAMWLALALWAGARHSYLAAGLAFGLAVTTRPITAIILAATVMTLALSRKGLGNAGRLGLGALPGVAVLFTYNWWVFGVFSIRGGYADRFDTRLVDSSLISYLENIGLGLFHPLRGLLVMSPFIPVLLLGARRAWRTSSAFERGSTVGAVLYLLFIWRAEQYAGGAGFWSYRYPLEALIALVPLMVRSLTGLVFERPRWFRFAIRAGVVSIVLHIPSIHPF